MTAHARLDPQTGGLLVSGEGWREMLSRSAGATDPAAGHHDEAWDALTQAGAADGDRLHPTLERALEAVDAPLAELRIERRGTVVSGWCDTDAAVLLVPREPDLLEVAPAAVRFLPDLVARLVELAPRPAGERRAVTVAPGALAQAVAAPESRASEADLPAVRDFWLLEITEPQTGAVLDRLEVLDTDDGLWRLERDEGRVGLEPTSASHVWRRLTAIVAGAVR